MSESRPHKRKVEFIESYWTGGEFGSDYQWNDNHGELIRCKDCKHFEPDGVYTMCYRHNGLSQGADWFCADGEKKSE